MSRIGLRIALPGYDARTASPEQCAVDSNYDTMKLPLDEHNPYFGRVKVTFATNPNTPGYVKNLLTFTWKFNYTPIFYFYFDILNSDKALSDMFGNEFSNDIFGEKAFRVTRSGNKLSFDYVVTANSLGFDMTGKTFMFTYTIFANEGV